MSGKISFNKNNEGSDYEPTDSEDDYSEEEKELLRNVRESNKREVEEKQEVLRFDDSDDEEEVEDDEEAQMSESDIEGAEPENEEDGLPSALDWGDKSRNYYNTDFVDRDYDEYNEQEMEMAQQEEEEAKNIQQRLLKQMKDADFMLDAELLKAAEAKNYALPEEATKVKTDLSGLSKREQQRLFAEDSPEFEGLTANFAEYLQEQQQLVMPVLNYVKENNLPQIPAFQFAQVYQQLVLSYCSNVAFYLLLKARRAPIRSHPITKRLLSLKLLLTELTDRYENIIRPQFEALLERIQDGDQFEVLVDETVPVERKKKSKLAILDEFEATADMPAAVETATELADEQMGEGEEEEDGEEEQELEEEMEDGDTRRGITYQIAKNKGLTPYRKKELRNPRVKHRSKFRKALIRRKGAVRTVRKETKRYGGELSGIKSNVTKSIKFKV